jgi:hypothetical protein
MATSGGRLVERAFGTWAVSPTGMQAASDVRLNPPVERLRQSWAQIRTHDLADGPGPAATRYAELSASARALAGGFPLDLPSAGIPGLLHIDRLAQKHSIRLHATAVTSRTAANDPDTASRTPDPTRAPADQDASTSPAYRELPRHVAAVSGSGHSGIPLPARQDRTPASRPPRIVAAQRSGPEPDS